MDELKDTWNQLKAKGEQSGQLSKEEILGAMRKESIGVLESLTKKVFIKFQFCLGFALVFIGLLPFIPVQSQILLSILAVAYSIGGILLYKEYQYLRKKTFMDLDLLSGLKTFRNRVSKAVHYEELVGLALYPVSGAGGWFIGYTLFGHNPEMSTQTWIGFGITLLILTPLAHLVARWLNRRTFGKLIRKLNSDIAELESREE